MSLFTIKCHDCGKFISDEDTKTGKAHSEAIWDYGPCSPGLDDVIWSCVRCTEIKKDKRKSKERTEGK